MRPENAEWIGTKTGWWVAITAPNQVDVSGARFTVENPQEFVDFLREWVDVPHNMTRAAYEQWCAHYGVTPKTDEALSDNRFAWGDFDFSTYFKDAETRNKRGIPLVLEQRRHFALARDARDNPPAPKPDPVYQAPVKEGQLWEPCEQCGREPCYMPLNLCDRCWPK